MMKITRNIYSTQKLGQITVKDLIEILERDFDGNEPVWYRTNDDPSRCYEELWERDVRCGGVSVPDGDDEVERLCQCIIGELPV